MIVIARVLRGAHGLAFGRGSVVTAGGWLRPIAVHRAYDADDRRGREHQHEDQREAAKPHVSTSIHTLYSSTLRSRSALPITDTELKVMAALAIIGLSSTPNHG